MRLCGVVFLYIYNNTTYRLPKKKNIYLRVLRHSLLRCHPIPSICVHRRVGSSEPLALVIPNRQSEIRFLETEKRLMQLLNFFITAHLLLQSQVVPRIIILPRLFRLVLDDITSPLVLAMVTSSSVNEEYFPPY